MSDNTKSHKHDIPAMSGKGDNTKSADPRFTLKELQRCICRMRVFQITDTDTGERYRAHVGNLNPHDLGHMAVAALLEAERSPRPEFGFMEHAPAGTESMGIQDCVCGGSWMPKSGTCTGFTEGNDK